MNDDQKAYRSPEENERGVEREDENLTTSRTFMDEMFKSDLTGARPETKNLSSALPPLQLLFGPDQIIRSSGGSGVGAGGDGSAAAEDDPSLRDPGCAPFIDYSSRNHPSQSEKINNPGPKPAPEQERAPEPAPIPRELMNTLSHEKNDSSSLLKKYAEQILKDLADEIFRLYAGEIYDRSYPEKQVVPAKH